MRRVLLMSLLLPGAVLAQEAPGTKLSIDAVATSAAIVNGTTMIDFELSSAPGSVEQLFQFIVAAPAPITGISSPEPAADWKTDTEFRSMSVAMWTVLGDQLGPGQSGPTLSISAVGLPGIVDAWYRGWAPPPPLPEDLPLDYASDPLADASVAQRVVGIEPFPEREPDALLDRLHGLIQEACGPVSWISDAEGCLALGEFTISAREDVAALRFAEARTQLEGVLGEVEAGLQSGDVNHSAYWLIRTNTELIRDLLPNPPAVQATLNPVPGKSLKHNKGHFTVDYMCQSGTITSAILNGIPVENGEEAELNLKSKKSKKDAKSVKSRKAGKSLKLSDTSFELEVMCENQSGTSTATAWPVFAEKSTKSKKGK